MNWETIKPVLLITAIAVYVVPMPLAHRAAIETADDMFASVSKEGRDALAILLTMFWGPVATLGAVLVAFDWLRSRTKKSTD